MRSLIHGLSAAALVCVALVAASQQMPLQAEARPQEFHVLLEPGMKSAAGRLIAVAAPVASVNASPDLPHPPVISASGSSIVASQDAGIVMPGQAIRFDADMAAFPDAFSRIAPGEYWVQVRLDTNGNAAYRYSDPENDFTSVPVKMQLPSAQPIRVTLKPEREVVRAGTPPTANGPGVSGAPTSLLPGAASVAPGLPVTAEADLHIKPIEFKSPALSEFWGRPTYIRGIVLLPPGYETSRETYPVVYRTEGFGASLGSLPNAARRHFNLMKTGETPPMIRVFLDHSSPWGTHEFADSVNNGPWGRALTEEFIPWFEKEYRADGKVTSRFTTGHSSGGWFAIWQQVRYPGVFGGTWARAPDPVDFRSFTGIDIYRLSANAYTRPDGSPQYLVRDATGAKTMSFREYAQRERVLGAYGGQIDSFDWVFSPRGNDGRPQPLFDRLTGKIDPEVADYWKRYDISYILRRDWASLRPVLDGKIHLIMGTMDTFHLDEAARLLDQELKKLGANAQFTWMEGRAHGNLDMIDGDPNGLEKKIAWEMWLTARPDSRLRPSPGIGSAPVPTVAK